MAQKNLAITQRTLLQGLEKLSSGKKINHAYDDASGFLLATQLTFKINGVNAGTSNLQMAVDLMSTADSYTQTISEDLGKMQELATQSNNGLLTPAERQALQPEYSELVNEIQRLTTNASYNGRAILDGSLQNVTVQSGFSVADTVTANIGNFSTGATGLNIANTGISTQADAVNALAQISSAVQNVLSPNVAQIGAQSAGWLKSADAQDAYAINLTAARSSVMDADIAAETTDLTNSQVVNQFGMAALAQANSIKQYMLKIFGF